MSVDIYDEFTDYFLRIVNEYSKDGLILCYNNLYLTKGLTKSPIHVRNAVIDDICNTSYESIEHVFQLKKLPKLKYQKLLRIINTIKNKKDVN